MKITKILFVLVFTFVFISASGLMAQEEKNDKDVIMKHHPPKEHGKDFMPPPIPDLTELQKSKMKEIHLKAMKETLPVKNEIGEKEAKLRTLTTVSNPDETEIMKLLDEIGELHTKIRKIELKSHLEVRSFLTEEQKVFIDSIPKK